MSATLDHVDLPITGMTCASCATRVERRLNELDGVRATVNYATEKATVAFDPGAVDPRQLVQAVEAAGYQRRAAGGRAGRRAAEAEPDDDARRCAGASSSPPCCRCPCCCWRWSRRCSSTTSSGCRWRSSRPVVLWARGRSTGPRGRTSGTAPRRWTR